MIEINCSEKDIEDFLCKENNLERHLGLRFLARQFTTPLGIVDIVAYNKNTKRFVIIELKKDALDSKAFFQMERYRHYFKTSEHKKWFGAPPHKEERKFDCLLIGKDIAQDLYYSVEIWDCVDDLRYASMWYTCFSYGFDTAIAFNYSQPGQRKIQDEFEGMYGS